MKFHLLVLIDMLCMVIFGLAVLAAWCIVMISFFAVVMTYPDIVCYTIGAIGFSLVVYAGSIGLYKSSCKNVIEEQGRKKAIRDYKKEHGD